MAEINGVIENIEKLTEILGDLTSQFVFVGGSVVSLYAKVPLMDEIRPTKDIDLVIELDGYSDIPDLDKQLFKKGFAHCTQKGAPLCRYRVEGLVVDIMPTKSDVWGFTNRWYEEGLKNVIEYRLQNNNVIKLLSLPYFLASKMEAFSARAKTILC